MTVRAVAQGMSKRFGGLQALNGVSFAIEAGQVLAVIGPNGAGKSTLINCLSGALAADAGSLELDGQAVPPRCSDRLVELGITRTFQHARLFPSLTVLEHLLLARRSFERTRRCSSPGRARTVCLELLDRVGLAAKARQSPSELAYGEQRRLEVARGLATEPKLFLVDELAAGSTATEQGALAGLIEGIAATGAAVLLVEHHMDLIARVADAVLVLNFGEAIATGRYADVKRDPAVIAAYLGSAAA